LLLWVVKNIYQKPLPTSNVAYDRKVIILKYTPRTGKVKHVIPLQNATKIMILRSLKSVQSTLIVTTLVLVFGSGCANILYRATNNMAANLSHAMLNHDDLDTIKGAAPAYLLMADGLLQDYPNDIDLLTAAAQMYNAYASVFVSEPERAKRLTQRALDYAQRAACMQSLSCNWRKLRFTNFKEELKGLTIDDVPVFYTLGSTWAGWIQTRSDDWNAIAELPRVTAIMQRIIELDETYQQGAAHLYLGVTNTLLSPAMGGKPELGREHFEQAIRLSNGQNLTVKVLYARHYARLVFNRELFEHLLQEVISADPVVPDLTLMNILAQQQAQQLLAEANDYF
jgi:hypothetical protein